MTLNDISTDELEKVRIPKKLEGGPIEFRTVSELITEDEDWMPENYTCVVGQPAVWTKNRTPYTTYAVGVRLSDDITEYAVRLLLEKCVNRQLVEASRAGVLVVRKFPDYEAYTDDSGNPCLRVSMRYAIE